MVLVLIYPAAGREMLEPTSELYGLDEGHQVGDHIKEDPQPAMV